MYFDWNLGDQEKNWVPHIFCPTFATTLTTDERKPQCGALQYSNGIGVSQKTILAIVSILMYLQR
jgi:hypothetical protein